MAYWPLLEDAYGYELSDTGNVPDYDEGFRKDDYLVWAADGAEAYVVDSVWALTCLRMHLFEHPKNPDQGPREIKVEIHFAELFELDGGATSVEEADLIEEAELIKEAVSWLRNTTIYKTYDISINGIGCSDKATILVTRRRK